MATSDSRRLRRVIKEYIRKTEITNPKFKQMRNKIITEFFAKDLTTPPQTPIDYHPDPWSGGIERKREAVLQHLTAKPFKLGINPHGYQLDVDVYSTDKNGKKIGPKQDRLWFYEGGDFYSSNQPRTMFYRVSSKDPHKLLIYTDSDARDTSNPEFLAGDITLVGNRPVYNVASNETKEKPLDWWDKTEDIIHTILDWLGVIPGWGDVIDIVNGVWYLIDALTEDDPWLYLEAFLSLIAVIPLIGSGIKIAFKTAIQAGGDGIRLLLRSSIKGGNVADTYKLWEEILRNGTFTKSELEAMRNGLSSIGQAFSKAQDVLPDSIYKELDKFSKWTKDSDKAIKELTELGVKKAGKTASGLGALNKTVNVGADAAEAGLNLVGRVIPIKPHKVGGLFKRFRRTGVLPEGKLLKLAKGMENRFVDELAKSPQHLTVLLKQTPNPSALLNELKGIEGGADIIKKYFTKKVPKTYKSGPKAGQTFYVNVEKSLDSIKASDVGKMFDEFKNLPGDAWNRAKKYTGEHAIKNDSWLWNGYRTNSIKELRTVLSKRYMGGEGIRGLIPDKADVKTFRKWVDVVYNELHDAGEDITKDEIADNPTGVIYPMLKYGLEKTLPGTKQSIESFRDAAVENPMVKIGMSMLGIGVTKDGELKQMKNIGYDPFAEAGGEYK